MLFKPRRSWLLTLAALAALSLAGLPARAAEKTTDKTTHKTVSVAHIKLSGDLDEKAPAADPLLGSLGESFKVKLERIKKAANDKSIQGLYLEVNGLSISWGKIDELERAVADFRKSGKKVLAYVESGTSRDYLAALACDEVCMPEAGWLMLTGMRAEISFYKELLANIGVRADLMQMGDYKSAAEPFTRTRLSEPSRKQLELVLDDYFQKSLVERIAHARSGKKLSPEQVKKLIDQGPFTARRALEAGLIDRVASGDNVKDLLQGALGASEVKLVKDYGKEKSDVDLSDIFALYRKLLFPPKPTISLKPKVAVIYATGPIHTGKSSQSLLGGDTCGSETIVEAIRQAEKNNSVKAIVLRVDSPGGSALASDLIWNELVRCKKPVVASMSDVAASGGYYISMGARKIYAEPGTLTGSIGVFGGKLVLGGLYKKIGIDTEVIARGANSGIFSSTHPFSDSEREALKTLMKDVYDQFVDKALEGRKKAGKKMNREELLKLAGGRIWTGRQAKENGLVDELGTLEDAIAAAKKLAKEPTDRDMDILELPKSKNFLDLLLEKSESRAPDLGAQHRLLRSLPELAGKLGHAEILLQLRGEPVWLLLPYQIEVR